MRVTETGRKLLPPDLQRMPLPHEKRETLADVRARIGYVFIECDFTTAEMHIFAQVHRS